MDNQTTDVQAAQFAEDCCRLQQNIERVIKGKPEVVATTLTCLFAEGHLLIEDVPGVGKTSVARALAASIAGEFTRIQFTPDLLPTDVTGVTIMDQATGEFRFKPGDVFANIVLGDEINRASPKTQSALLEVMEERHVSANGETHPVPRPFMVVATQNPVEMDGTYRLPEAQLDRFLIRTGMGYPSHAAEIEVLDGYQEGHRRRLAPAGHHVHPRPGDGRRRRRRPRRRGHQGLHRAADGGDARARPSPPGRQPSRQPGPAARGPGLGGRRGPVLRHPRGRTGPGGGGLGPPHDPYPPRPSSAAAAPSRWSRSCSPTIGSRRRPARRPADLVTAPLGAEPPRRRVPRLLTRRGRLAVTGTVLAYAAGLATGYPELFVVAAAGLGALGLALVWILRRPRLDITRTVVDDRVERDAVAFGELSVRNAARWSSPPSEAYEPCGDLAPPEPIDLDRLPGHGSAIFRYEIPTARRAAFSIGPLELRRVDPLGLMRVSQVRGGRIPFWVHPRSHALVALPPGSARSLDGPDRDQAPHGSTTFHALREYVIGDDLRHVHWRSSARMGDLMVREHIDVSLPDTTPRHRHPRLGPHARGLRGGHGGGRIGRQGGRDRGLPAAVGHDVWPRRQRPRRLGAIPRPPRRPVGGRQERCRAVRPGHAAVGRSPR
jgi:hypothetical protein